MAARKADVAQAIQFVEPFDHHVSVMQTVSYRPGDVVQKPSAQMVAAAGARAVPHAEEEQPAGEE